MHRHLPTYLPALATTKLTAFNEYLEILILYWHQVQIGIKIYAMNAMNAMKVKGIGDVKDWVDRNKPGRTNWISSYLASHNVPYRQSFAFEPLAPALTIKEPESALEPRADLLLDSGYNGGAVVRE